MTTYLITFALALGSVGMWTLRVATTARGYRFLGAGVAMVEATTYVAAISHVIGSLDAPLHVAAYAAGVGAGTYLGITLDTNLGRSSGPSHWDEADSADSTNPREPVHSRRTTR